MRFPNAQQLLKLKHHGQEAVTGYRRGLVERCSHNGAKESQTVWHRLKQEQ